MALVRKSPDYDDPKEIASSIMDWNRYVKILDAQLTHTKAYMAGNTFSLADIIFGLAVNRWIMSPIEHANCPAVISYYERLKQRDGFLKNGAGYEP